MIKRILLTFASLFLIWQSYVLLTNVQHIDISLWWLNLLYAWLINMFITGIFAFMVFAHPVEQLLPDFYYDIHHPKRLKKLYNRLGVDYFRKFLLATVWKSKKQGAKLFDGTAAGIAHMDTQSKKSEFGHLFPFIILIMVSIYLGILGLWQMSIFLMMWNILGNFYPVPLQRYHRMRIQRLRKIMNRKHG